jgi:hypothetical protein
MAFKYKLAENKPTGDPQAGTGNWSKELLKKWDKEWDEKQAETTPPSNVQERIKVAVKKALSEKKCWDGYESQGKKIKDGKSVNDCKPINK